jgi:hypothetical protein
MMPVRGKWDLAVVCGVELGAVNLAFDTDGRPYSGADVEPVRQRFRPATAPP